MYHMIERMQHMLLLMGCCMHIDGRCLGAYGWMDGWMVNVWMHVDGWMDGRCLDAYGWMDGWMDGRSLFKCEFPSPHMVWSIGDTHLPCMTSAHIHMATGSLC